MEFRVFHILCFSDFVQSNKVLIRNNAVSFFANVINQFCTSYFAGNKPTITANLTEQIRFTCSRRSKFNKIQVLFYERQQTLNNRQFLRSAFISSRIIVNRRQHNINPLIQRETFTGRLIFFQISFIRTEIREVHQLNFARSFCVIRILIAQFNNTPIFFRFQQCFTTSIPNFTRNCCILIAKTEIRKGEGNLTSTNVNFNTNLRKNLNGFTIVNDSIFKVLPILFLWDIGTDKVRSTININFAIIILEVLHYIVTHERRKFERGNEVVLLKILEHHHGIKGIFKTIDKVVAYFAGATTFFDSNRTHQAESSHPGLNNPHCIAFSDTIVFADSFLQLCFLHGKLIVRGRTKINNSDFKTIH